MEFVKVAAFSSRLEAEAIGLALEQHGIAFYVMSEDLGIFGPGHTGATPQGAGLWVPEDKVSEVKSLISCVFEPPAEEASDEE
jgi:hypothetical protein